MLKRTSLGTVRQKKKLQGWSRKEGRKSEGLNKFYSRENSRWITMLRQLTSIFSVCIETSTSSVKYYGDITKTCLYDFDPLKPHFSIEKLGFKGVYIIFVFLLAEAVLTSTHNLCFDRYMKKYRSFYLKLFSFLEVKFSIYLNRRVFVIKHECNYDEIKQRAK